MTGISNQNLFNGMASLVEDDISYHSITTDNPYMAEIGLSVFTTGQLYNWMSQRNSRGEFVNLGYFNWGQSNPLAPGETVENRILGGKLGTRLFGANYNDSHCPNDPKTNPQLEWMSFSKWEKKGRSGEYIKTPYNGWKYYNKYQFSDIDFFSYNDYDIELRPGAGPFDNFYNLFAVPGLHIDDIVSTIITLNDQARFLPVLRDFYANPDSLPLSWRAAYEYIMDIKGSQERCVQWTNTIPFVARVGNSQCVKQECVKFKLYLYDFSNPKNSNRTIAFNADTFRIAMPKSDPFGRLSNNDGTGSFDLPESNPDLAAAQKTVVDIGAFKASPMVLVKLASNLEAAEWAIDIDDFNDAVETYCGYEKGLKPGTGIAIPIQEQNGNPLQWAPQYLEQGCNKTTNEKFTIVINNFDKKLYQSGIMGYATKFTTSTGHTAEWSFIPIGQYQDVADTRPRNWSFTYLMMNYDNFFRARPRYVTTGGQPRYLTVGLSANSYEEYVRQYYYGDFTVDPNLALERLDSFPALQITSWDFMGPSVGGLREDGHALSCTVWNLNNDGTPWPDYEQGKYSTPFFGCVFPGGYQTDGKIEQYRNPSTEHFVVRQTGALSQVSLGNKTVKNFINEIPTDTRITDNEQNDASPTRSTSDDNGNNILFSNGIFYEQGDLVNTVNHLPADIATNSSRNPLQNYYHIYSAFQAYDHSNTTKTQQQYQLALSGIIGKNYNDKSIWIHASGNPDAPLFDFQPNNLYKIQFRPLKHEVYDSFQRVDIVSPNKPNTDPSQIEYNRTRFAREAKQWQRKGNVPIYTEAINRDTWFSSTWTPHGADFRLIGAGRNSQTGMRINQAKGASGGSGWSLRYNYGLINVGRKYSLPSLPGFNSNAKFPWLWRDIGGGRGLNLDDDYSKLGDEYGSGAIGVIGVAFTLALESKIGLNTNSLFGMRSTFGGGNNILGPKPWYQAFGGYGDNYNSLHNTQLYARIFQHWPKEYTVYDPSKFAVFHFNTNSDDLDYIDYYTSSGNVALSPGTYVWKNGIGVPGSVTSMTLEARQNPYRKEKLLPCKYKMEHTIGIDLANQYISGGTSSPPNAPTNPQNYSVVIDAQGTGYRKTDTFKVVGGNGTSPVLSCIVDNDGKITGFNYVDEVKNGKGYNYRQEDFLDAGEDFTKTNAGLKISPVTVYGSGFSGRIVTGIGVVSPFLIDAKPKSIGEPFIQLTPSVPVREDPNSVIMEPVTGQRITNIIIDPQFVSKDGLYDVFLHFHNDTSHTFISDTSAGDSPALEQYVELEIIPG